MKNRRRPGGFRPLEEVAAAAGALLPHSHRGRHLRALAAWRAAVGDPLTRSTRVARLDGGLMTVQVPGEAHRESVRRLEREILERVQQQMGGDAPRRIRVEVSPGFWRPPQGPAPRSEGAVPSTPAPRTPASTAADGGGDSQGPRPAPGPAGLLGAHDVAMVEDRRQREALLRVANRYLSRRARRR